MNRHPSMMFVLANNPSHEIHHVDCECYDVERLTKYLSMHDIVGVEIFQYCEKEKPDGTGVFHKTVLGRNSEKASACWNGQY